MSPWSPNCPPNCLYCLGCPWNSRNLLFSQRLLFSGGNCVGDLALLKTKPLHIVHNIQMVVKLSGFDMIQCIRATLRPCTTCVSAVNEANNVYTIIKIVYNALYIFIHIHVVVFVLNVNVFIHGSTYTMQSSHLWRLAKFPTLNIPHVTMGMKVQFDNDRNVRLQCLQIKCIL